ncbi:MAG: DUF3597 domain-containing protein [Gemmatimonadota bacterium]|nr:DUF3597 domain-containing protein [Gemmatimonadota bacterium]
MSIFGSIMSKVFGHTEPATAGAVASSAPSAAPTASAPAPTAPTKPTPISQADAEALLANIASNYSHPVNWKTSIVDLMAILGIDNSLAQRKALAQELGYTGDMNDSATMNIWLHKQVMTKLEENGGYVPADLTK